jgi:hypothetical protein
MKIKSVVAILTIFSMMFAMQMPALAAMGQQDAASRGTVFTVRMTNTIGSDRSQPGDPVRAVLDEPMISGGRVIFPQGTRVEGVVNEVTTPHGGQSNGSINFVFNRLITPDGREIGIVANLEGYSEYHESSWRQRALTLAIAIGAGAIISKIFGGSFLKGVLIGGAAGTGYVLYRDGDHIVLEEGTTINLVLEETITVNYETADTGYQESNYDDSSQGYATPIDESAENQVSEPLSNESALKEGGTLVNGPASTIVLGDGSIESGVFSGFSQDGKVLINKQYGQLSIPVGKVNELVFDTNVDADANEAADLIVLKNGNALSGMFSGFSAGKVVLNTNYGELRIPLQDIARIKFFRN